MKKGKNEKAAKVLSRVHKNEKKVENELNEIQATLQESEKQRLCSTLKDLFHWQTIHRYLFIEQGSILITQVVSYFYRVILGMILQLFNRLVGITVIS